MQSDWVGWMYMEFVSVRRRELKYTMSEIEDLADAIVRLRKET